MSILNGTKYTGRLHIELKDESGAVKETRDIDNLVVTSGLGWIAGRLYDTSIPDQVSHIAVGTGSTAAAAGDTALGTESHREALDSTTVSSNTVTWVSSLEAGDGTGALTEAGLFNAASGGTMIARTVFSVINKGASDTLSISWVLTASAS